MQWFIHKTFYDHNEWIIPTSYNVFYWIIKYSRIFTVSSKNITKHWLLFLVWPWHVQTFICFVLHTIYKILFISLSAIKILTHSKLKSLYNNIECLNKKDGRICTERPSAKCGSQRYKILIFNGIQGKIDLYLQ